MQPTNTVRELTNKLLHPQAIKEKQNILYYKEYRMPHGEIITVEVEQRGTNSSLKDGYAETGCSISNSRRHYTFHAHTGHIQYTYVNCTYIQAVNSSLTRIECAYNNLLQEISANAHTTCKSL